ncbi:hypothetical protein BCEN4_480050 [Burkholderia cenocepacia]|nr:hypothetical protein BCEN4_480050 [Burkholderia cenocepacia]
MHGRDEPDHMAERVDMLAHAARQLFVRPDDALRADHADVSLLAEPADSTVSAARFAVAGAVDTDRNRDGADQPGQHHIDGSYGVVPGRGRPVGHAAWRIQS